MDKCQIKIFAGSSGQNLGKNICNYLNIPLGSSEVITFSEGNTFVKVNETVRGKDVYLVQSIGLNPNNEFVEILFWLDAFKRASVNSVTLLMPYFSYAKGDKKDEPRVSIRARVCAESIELAGADRIVTMDLHSPQVQGFFKKPVDHLYALSILCEHIKTMNIDNLIVASPDVGNAKEARRYASYLGTKVAIGDKSRDDHSEAAKIVELIGDVKNKNVLIVDDFSISGGTLIAFAELLKKKGAKKIYASLSHILLNKKGIKKIEDSPIELVLSTDSVENKYISNSDKIKVLSCGPLLAETVKRIHNKESVSSIFSV